jgi:GTP:adenosylcobinamide-phosphate guanylyltransferase
VCGAYEAIAAGKPLITSTTAALRSYFAEVAVFTAHDPPAIARAVEEAYAGRERLTLQVSAWSARNEQYLGERLAALGRVLQGLAAQVQPARQAF